MSENGGPQISTKMLVDVDEQRALLGGILYRARLDAEKGNLCALAFLIAEGAGYAEFIAPGGGAITLKFCREQWEIWGNCDIEADWLNL